MAKRRRKSQFAKLRAKANKAVARKVKAVRKQARKRVRRVERFLQSNSLARTAKRASKRATRQTTKTIKASLRKSRNVLKKTAKARRQTIKSLRRTRKQLKKSVVSAQKFYRAQKRQRRSRIAAQNREVRARNKALRAKQRNYDKLALEGSVDLSQATLRETSDKVGASLPGEPPRMRTGKGRSSISAELRKKGQKIEARTFVDKKIAPYMAMWEFAPPHKRRPFLKPAVADNIHLFSQKIAQSLTYAVRGQGGLRKATVR